MWYMQQLVLFFIFATLPVVLVQRRYMQTDTERNKAGRQASGQARKKEGRLSKIRLQWRA